MSHNIIVHIMLQMLLHILYCVVDQYMYISVYIYRYDMIFDIIYLSHSYILYCVVLIYVHIYYYNVICYLYIFSIFA